MPLSGFLSLFPLRKEWKWSSSRNENYFNCIWRPMPKDMGMFIICESKGKEAPFDWCQLRLAAFTLYKSNISISPSFVLLSILPSMHLDPYELDRFLHRWASHWYFVQIWNRRLTVAIKTQLNISILGLFNQNSLLTISPRLFIVIY